VRGSEVSEKSSEKSENLFNDAEAFRIRAPCIAKLFHARACQKVMLAEFDELSEALLGPA
jgi:hypothetical protein